MEVTTSEPLFPPLKLATTELEDLYDDAILEVFRRMTLYDLVRTEAVFGRWQNLQRQVLGEVTRLVLLDDQVPAHYMYCILTATYLKSPCDHIVENAHNSRSLNDDFLPISCMDHMVSFLYFLAPRMPNVKVLMVNISWATPEQLSQLLLKFSKVECLTLLGTPTDNAAEWAPVRAVLDGQYTGLRHFVTNFHLEPEKYYDPYIVYAREQFSQVYSFFSEKALEQWHVLRGLDLMHRGYTKVASLCGVTSPAVEAPEEEVEEDEVMETDDETTDDETDDEMEEEDEEIVEEILDDEEAVDDAPQDTDFFSRAPFKWIDPILMYFCLFFRYIAQPILGPLPPSLVVKVRPPSSNWKFLSQVEELHIPNHQNKCNKLYSFDSKIGSSGKMRKLTIGDVLLLDAFKEHLFQTLTYLHIDDFWDSHFVYLFRKLPMCQQLVELHITFRSLVEEETTIDLLDYLNEGVHLYSGKGFPQLSTLGLHFPLASLSRHNLKKFTYIFSNISHLSVDVSRIKVERRSRLIRMAERGLPNLRSLTILKKGRGDFSWLECSRSIATFNLDLLPLISVEHLFAFYHLALYRDERASRGLDVQHRHITLWLNPVHYNLAKRWFSMKIEEHPEVAEVTEYPDNLHVREKTYNY